MATYRTRTARDGSTSVHAQVRMTGYPARTASFANKRDAQKWAATVEADMIEGRHFKDASGRKRTLAEAIKRFRAEVLPLKKDGSMYGFTLAWWEANHGTKRLGEVSRGWLADCRTELLSGTFTRATPGSKRSLLAADQAAPTRCRTPATANRYMAALSAVFSQACGDWEWLQPAANPFAGFGKLPEGKHKGKAYADEARAKLLQAAAADPQLHRLVRVALGTAARAGELVGLTWSHVELGETEGRLMFEDTKNGESRIAWLYGDALKAILEQFTRVGGVMGEVDASLLSRPVFPGQWSHKAQRYGRYDYLPRLHKALAAAGLTMKRPFHALRHTAATTLARMGANAHQLKAIGGWKSDAVNTYVHMAAQDTKVLSEALAKRLAAPEGGK
jgi:integrase